MAAGCQGLEKKMTVDKIVAPKVFKVQDTDTNQSLEVRLKSIRDGIERLASVFEPLVVRFKYFQIYADKIANIRTANEINA